MNDQAMTDRNLMGELESLRHRVAELERVVADHKRREDVLRRREQAFDDLAENIPNLVVRFDTSLRHLYVNKAVEQITGLSKAAYLHKTNEEMGMPPELVSFWNEKLNEAIRTATAKTMAFQFTDADGITRDFEAQVIPEFSDNEQVESLLSIVRDVSQRKQAERKLQESEEQFRNLVEYISDVIYEIDSKGVLVYVSPVIRDVLGYEPADIVGKNFIEFVYEDDRNRLMALFSDLRTGIESPSEYRLTDKSGNPKWVRTKTRPILQDGWFLGARGTLIDITERKRAESNLIETVQQLQDTRDMLVQFEKQAAVGRLAAGVAHEILNPASIISSRLQFLEEENLGEPARENLRVSREQLQRIVKISRDLHQASSNHQIHLVGDDFRQIIEMGLQMTERRIKDEHIRIEYDPPVETIPVKMAISRLITVMVHLILNACDAMIGKQDKRLIITVRYHAVSQNIPSMLLAIADNGHGIPPGDLNRIFDPFFTTKEPGKGTGLGLSVCKGIIQEHGGTIHAVNNVVGGTTLIVELPLYQR